MLLTFLLDYSHKKQLEQMQPQVQYFEETYEYEPETELAGTPQNYF